MAFTEFYSQTTGSNLNAGSTTGDAAVFTFANGNWDSTTGIFIATGADLSAIAVGMFASVYLDAATVGVFVGRITAVNDTTDTITVSLTAKSGTAPATGATGRSIKIGGAWKGPNAAVAFPFGFITNTLTNAAGDYPRVNLKSGTTYSITAAMTHANAGSVTFQGYTTTVGDGGKAIIDGGTSGASYILLLVSGNDNFLTDIIFQNNGATGDEEGVRITGSRGQCLRVVANSIRGNGLNGVGTVLFVECETYACNQANSSGKGGVLTNADAILIRCFSHDNAGSNSSGFRTYGISANFQDCVADSNGGDGFLLDEWGIYTLSGCDSYNNGGNGFKLANDAIATYYLESCNAVKNGAYGINGSTAQVRNGAIINCGFGSGTQANTSGTTTGLSAMVETGSINYASNVTPWVDPANGDFRINLAAAKGTGRGAFTQTAPSYAGTVGYPDVGAAQHLETPGGVKIVGPGGLAG